MDEEDEEIDRLQESTSEDEEEEEDVGGGRRSERGSTAARPAGGGGGASAARHTMAPAVTEARASAGTRPVTRRGRPSSSRGRPDRGGTGVLVEDDGGLNGRWGDAGREMFSDCTTPDASDSLDKSPKVGALPRGGSFRVPQ